MPPPPNCGALGRTADEAGTDAERDVHASKLSRQRTYLQPIVEPVSVCVFDHVRRVLLKDAIEHLGKAEVLNANPFVLVRLAIGQQLRQRDGLRRGQVVATREHLEVLDRADLEEVDELPRGLPRVSVLTLWGVKQA